MRVALLFPLLLAGVLASPSFAGPEARLLHFTDDGTEGGTPLFPGFPHNSVWSAIGTAQDGMIYVGVSNHDMDGAGNVALYRLDPATGRFTLLGDLQSASAEAGNWPDGESQHKIHTYLLEHADGRLYFGSMDRATLEGYRGGHLYALDPGSGHIEDLSATAPFRLDRDLNRVPNDDPGDPARGVLLEGRGIKGIGLHPDCPDLIYAMTNFDGLLVRHDLSDGDIAVIGHSASVSYGFHVTAACDVLYLGGEDPVAQDLLVYRNATGETEALGVGPIDDVTGLMLDGATGELISVLLARSKDILLVRLEDMRVFDRQGACGRNWWRLFHMAREPDDSAAYFVSINNDRALLWRDTVNGGRCQEWLDLGKVVGGRNLTFGGRGIWSGNRFYTPVWTHDETFETQDAALLEVTVR